MNKEEITEKAQVLTIKNVTDGKNKYFSWGFYKGCVVGLEYTNKQITELEEKISVLLSCKNCPENKGGYICAKEYENKCLSQKIQFIKELQQENAELKEKLKPENCLKLLAKDGYIKFTSDNLTKANDLLVRLSTCLEGHSNNNFEYELLKETEKFLKEVE